MYIYFILDLLHLNICTISISHLWKGIIDWCLYFVLREHGLLGEECLLEEGVTGGEYRKWGIRRGFHLAYDDILLTPLDKLTNTSQVKIPFRVTFMLHSTIMEYGCF